MPCPLYALLLKSPIINYSYIYRLQEADICITYMYRRKACSFAKAWVNKNNPKDFINLNIYNYIYAYT